MIRASAISELPNGSETLACTTNVSFGDQTVVEPTPSRRSIRSIRTYVVVFSSSPEAAKVEFIASNASDALVPMFRTVSRILAPEANVWSIPGNANVKGW